ncbi:hypothetical protein M0804_003891 [Polistes exclamans]|nr:hypothetical protein M0804_003891 [Polistes exclamans]
MEDEEEKRRRVEKERGEGGGREEEEGGEEERGRYPGGIERKRNPRTHVVCSIRKICAVVCILARRYLFSQEYLVRRGDSNKRL